MVDCGEQSLSLNAYKALTHGYPQVALINLAPSSIIHHPSSIIHHPSSIIHHPSGEDAFGDAMATK